MSTSLTRKVIVLAATIGILGSIIASPATAADDALIGGYDIVNIGGVDVLKDPESGIITYYNSIQQHSGGSGLLYWMEQST